MAPSHHLKQYWLVISEVLWHSPKRNVMVSAHATILYNEFQNYTFTITATSHGGQGVITLRSRQNEQHFADDIFKRIFFNENVWISIKISLKFVPKGPINNIPALVQIMAWRQPGDKALSEPMMVRLPTHICVTRPQGVNGYVAPSSWVYPTFSPISIQWQFSLIWTDFPSQKGHRAMNKLH